MPRLSTLTEGFYSVVSATNIADGGSISMEVARLDGTVVALVPISIQSGVATIDVPQSTTQAWPDNAKFRLIAVTPAGLITSKWMEHPGFGIEWTRRTAITSPRPYLNSTVITGSSHNFTFTDPAGVPARRYDLTIDGVDQGDSVEYPATSWPVTGLPTDGRDISVVLYWWDDIADMQQEPARIFVTSSPVMLSGNGTTLTGATYTLAWSDPAGASTRRYQAYVNGAATGAVASHPATSIALTGLPTNGSLVTLTLRYWDLPDESSAREVTITVFAAGTAVDGSIYSRTARQIYSVPTITPTTTTIIASGNTAGLWAALRAASPGDAVLGEAGGVYGADPLNLEDLAGTIANPVWFGGDSSSNRMRIECAGGTSWRNFRAPATGTPVYPGNTHARAMWWEGCSHIEGFNFEIWYAAYWGAMLGGADAGNSAAGLACTNIHFENFLVDGFSNAGIKWLNGSDAGLFEHFEIRNGDALTSYGGEPFYFGSGNHPNSGALGCTLRHFEMHDCNGELDIKRLTRGPLLFEYGHIHHNQVHSQGAITLGINNHSYGGTDPDITLRHLLIEDITNRGFNGNGITAAVPFTAEEVVIRNTVDDCIAIYGSYNTTDKDVTITNCILLPPIGKKAINDRAQTFLGQWPNMIRSGNYVPSAERIGTENAIQNQSNDYTQWMINAGVITNPVSVTVTSPASGFIATSAIVTLSVSAPGGYVFDWHISTTPQSPPPAVNNNVFDSSDIGTTTQTSFVDVTDGSARYGRLYYWPTNDYTAADMGYVDFQYTSYYEEIAEPPPPPPPPPGGTRMYGPAVAVAALNNSRIDLQNRIANFSHSRVAHRFVAKSTSLQSASLYHVMVPGNASGYSWGDGGLVRYSIYADDGTAASHPTGSPLAVTPNIVAAPSLHASQAAAASKYPGAIWSQYGESGSRLTISRRINFVSPATLVVGNLYHIVVDNTTPGGIEFISINFVRGSGRNKWKHFAWELDPQFPHKGKNLRCLTVMNGAWVERSDGQWAIYEHHYADGTIDGQQYIAISNTNDGDGDRMQAINGAKQVRSTWTPPATIALSEIAFYLGRQFGSSPVTVAIKQSATTLFTGQIAASQWPVMTGAPLTVVNTITEYGEWGKIALPNIVLQAGQLAYIEISTASGTEYEVFASQDGTQSGYFTGGSVSLGFKVGHMQVSNNGGSTWANMVNSGNSGTALDMAFYAMGAPV